MKKLIATIGALALAGCATIPKENIEDKFYNLMFQPLPTGLVNEYDTDGDGTGDLVLFYEIVGQDQTTAYFELRTIQEDRNRNGVYDKDEVKRIPSKNRFVKLK